MFEIEADAAVVCIEPEVFLKFVFVVLVEPLCPLTREVDEYAL